jgi:polar amino acid transport system substrate-binding protein
MKQVTQTLRTGLVEVLDVPMPHLGDRFVLVRNLASVISAGTEKTKIDMGRKNLLQKARARPDLVRQVMRKLQTEGLTKTLQTVGARLDSPSPLGYSCAGVVIAVGGQVEGLQPGDRVACAGVGYANHAELVAVPKNLVVRIPDALSFEEAAFSTLGSIALQGVRLAEPKLGECFLVIGLGLLGQITVQLLRANGCAVLGLDLDPSLVARAASAGVQGVPVGEAAAAAIMGMTGGHGVDGVLICAGTASNQPIALSGDVTREKGRVVVVGAVRMDIPREPYFRKEIGVVISRSYGPGRYDPDYEEGGRDYPFGYVRFTEQRNLETFVRLMADGRIDVRSLITHRFAVEDAAAAYALIEGARTEPYLGIVLAYAETTPLRAVPRTPAPKAMAAGTIGLSLFGAGNYATATLLPALKATGRMEFHGVVTASGRTAQAVSRQFGFAYAGQSFDDLLEDGSQVIGIASRHDTHASCAAHALRAGKHVYVEKPLALDMEGLLAVRAAMAAAPNFSLMVGFNRRFAPLTQTLRAHFSAVLTPLVINIRVNAGALAADHWIHDPALGGGRLIGEGCHFIDLAACIADSLPGEVHAVAAAHPAKSALTNDNVMVAIRFACGSIATVTYVADGSRAMPKEHVEVFGGGRSATLIDFRELQLFSGDSQRRVVKSGQDKGQAAMARAWCEALQAGVPCVPAEALLASSAATILAAESLLTGMPMAVALDD